MADATPEKKVISKGGCPCHKVRYTIEGPPKSTWVCHCLSCRKASGSLMMANSYIGVDQWRITEGEEHIKSWLDYNTSSGNPFTSYFCGLCGGNLYTSSEELKKEGAYVVQSGTLDDPLEWKPQMEFWTCRRSSWMPAFEKTKKFERNPQ